MSIKNEIHKYWLTVVDNFDELCVHTIFNTKVLAVDSGTRRGTRCYGYIGIMTKDGKYLARYPAKNIIDDFDYVRNKSRLFRDLLLRLRLKDADNKVNKAEPEEAEQPRFEEFIRSYDAGQLWGQELDSILPIAFRYNGD